MFRWSGFQSCGGWIEDEMDSEEDFRIWVVEKIRDRMAWPVKAIWSEVIPSKLVQRVD